MTNEVEVSRLLKSLFMETDILWKSSDPEIIPIQKCGSINFLGYSSMEVKNIASRDVQLSKARASICCKDLDSLIISWLNSK